MRPLRLAASLATATLLTAAAPAGIASASSSPSATAPSAGTPAPAPVDTFAVIGDVPYGQAFVDVFPKWVDELNAAPDVSFVAHVGDIKDGSSECSNSAFARIRTQFGRFADPLIYTPGDNEWTDCHRVNNGAYNPLERLRTIRRMFFSQPGVTLGRPMTVASQAKKGLPENVRFSRDGLRFATLHLVGSNNSLAPWTGLGRTAATVKQVKEEKARTAGAIAQLRDTFAAAKKGKARAVVLFTQADMFDVTVKDPQLSDYSAFTPVVRELITQSVKFGKPVYLFNGDSHKLNVDRPLAAGSRWLSFYGVRGAADNLQRITVDGSSLGNHWLKVTVAPAGSADVLSWENEEFVAKPAPATAGS